MVSFRLNITDCFVRSEANSGGGIILFVKEYSRKNNSRKFPAGVEIICLEFSICYKEGFFLGHVSRLPQ